MEENAEIMPLSEDGDVGETENGTVSPAPVTVPKKRGRPGGSEKPKKIPSGRGRGRPSKVVDGGTNNRKHTKNSASGEGSEEDGTISDAGSPVPNGDKTPLKRGRHPKRKRKLSHTVESTGKGRGRPKKVKADLAEDDDEVADDDDAASVDAKPVKKATSKPGKKGRGRPKKVLNSDDENSEDTPNDEQVRRPVGRPSSGGVNLNIVSTGKSRGRPKKKDTDKRVAKKPGRPATSGKGGAYSPTGKPRGRPKMAAVNKDSEEDDDEGTQSPKSASENSAAEDEEEDKAQTVEESEEDAA